MAKAVSCKDVGVDCNFVARGKTVDEVMKVAAKHGREVHGMKEISQELAKKMKAAVHDE